MPTILAGWSVPGILSGIAIVAGIALLIAYALRRGLFHRTLEGIAQPDAPVAAALAGDATDGRWDAAASRPAGIGARAAPARSDRGLGAAGAALLTVGLLLGVMTAWTSWGAQPAAPADGVSGPVDCAQSWSGCAAPSLGIPTLAP